MISIYRRYASLNRRYASLNRRYASLNSRYFYHTNTLDHYENPRNIGSLNKENQECWHWISWCPCLWRCYEITNKCR